MRETLTKRQRSKAKVKVRVKVAAHKKRSAAESKKKKELKKKRVSSGRTTASASRQSKKASAKVARKVKKVKKSAAVKKAVKKTAKSLSKRVKAKTKVVARKKVKAKASIRKAAARKVKARASIRKAAARKVKARASIRKAAARKVKVRLRTAAKSRLSSKGRRVVTASRSKSTGKVKIPLIVPPPPPPEPPRRLVSSGALRAFEHAVRVFNRRRFEDAKVMFENLLVKYPGEVEIVARAQMYIQVCNQKLTTEHRPTTPRNADELYDRGVFALNIGDFTQARTFFEKALRLRPDEPHLLYSLAATLAQTGSHEQALDYLKRSIQIQPRFRSQAYNDSDFSELRNNKQFLELIGLASPFDLLDSRR